MSRTQAEVMLNHVNPIVLVRGTGPGETLRRKWGLRVHFVWSWVRLAADSQSGSPLGPMTRFYLFFCRLTITLSVYRLYNIGVRTDHWGTITTVFHRVHEIFHQWGKNSLCSRSECQFMSKAFQIRVSVRVISRLAVCLSPCSLRLTIRDCSYLILAYINRHGPYRKHHIVQQLAQQFICCFVWIRCNRGV
jgi:hypothetical protein